MSELLQIVFQKGVDQSIDPRVAPSDVHAVAENVRWRKDGRPAKRYGSALVDTSALGAAYVTQPANLLATWNQIPVLAVGSAVRSLSAYGWLDQLMGERELPHFGPGEHDPIARNESVVMQCQTVGWHTSGARTTLLYAWQNTGGVSYLVRDIEGAIIRPPSALQGSLTLLEPRCISTNNFIYVLSKVGTNLVVDTFNPATATFIGTTSVGTLGSANDHFDGCGRGDEFLIIYQSGAAAVTTKIFTAVAVPVMVQTAPSAIAAATCRFAITGSATSGIFIAVLMLGIGRLDFAIFNNALTVALGFGTLDTDVANDAQPGLVLRSDTEADIVWGGLAPLETTYTRFGHLTPGGITGGFRTYYGVSPASKPFLGPAYAQLAAIDATYLWVETANSSIKWDTQRGYLLVRITNLVDRPLTPQLSVPNMPSSPTSRYQLGDVLGMGTGRGFVTALLNAIRYGNGLPAAYGVDSISFRSIFESPRFAARDTVTAGRALQFSGGSLAEFVGELSQSGFCNAPVIQTVAGAAGGGMVNGTYLYRAVYEYLDDQGRRHRSAPSDPFTFVQSGGTSASLTIKPLVADSHFPRSFGGVIASGVHIHIYRTLVGQGTLRRVTPNVNGPGGSVPGTATVTFLDTMGDALLGQQEFLYTEGGVVPNTLPPPCQFMTVCAGRVWLGGQLDRTVITASKLLVDGEPTQFSDDPVFSVFLPEKCTGIASIDGTIVAFARERIYLVSGDGPNDQGVGEFRPPVELPTDLGCIDWRSVVETSIGIFFQSKRGIYMMPRGFGTPVFVGLPIEATLAQYPIVVSATVAVEPSAGVVGVEPVLGEVSARFVLASNEVNASTVVAVYDLRTGGWSIDRRPVAPDQFGLGGTWLDRFVFSTSAAGGTFSTVRAETVGTYDDGSAGGGIAGYINSKLGTVDVRPFGVAGYGGFDRVVAVGEYRGNSIVTISVSVDGAAADVFTFPVTSADAPDGSVYLDVTPKTRIGASIRVTVADNESGVLNPTEGFLLQAVFIEHDTIGKTKRLAQARKA